MYSKKISKRYAKALFKIAKEKQEEKLVLDDCNRVLKALNNEIELLKLIKNPTIKKTIKINIFKKVFSSATSKTTMDFLALVIRKGREEMMKEVIGSYKTLYNTDKNIIVAEIISSKPLGLEMKEAIKQKISLTTQVELTEKIDNHLLGGFVVKTGDLQYDASVRKKINNVKRAFKL